MKMAEHNEVKAFAYNMACEAQQEVIGDMAREFERDLIISGNVPLSIVKQIKAEKMRLSEQRDSSRHNRVFEGGILYEKGADMTPYALMLTNVFPFSDVREIRYGGNELSIISGAVQKNYEIETKRGRVVGIKFKKKTSV